MKKYDSLLEYIRSFEKVVIAFSGGVDSSFLLKAAADAFAHHPENVLAITVKTPYIPNWEFKEAVELASSLGVQHVQLEMDIDDSIKNNPTNRCYLCKNVLFQKIIEYANINGFDTIFDGSNFDDQSDYRPGMRALKELKVVSPLLIQEWTKNEIRAESKFLGLSTFDKPAYACLLTRIPHETIVNIDTLEKIETAEVILHGLNIFDVRVRCHNEIARIEVGPENRKLFFNEKLMDQVNRYFKQLGFSYVTLDLGGYQMGSFNPKNKEE